MVTEAENAEEGGSELCESVNRCRDREKRRILKRQGNLTVEKVKERDSELNR